MHRAGRLLKLIQILRRHRTPVTAERLAREVEVSERTIYRDIAALIADGAPIRGEAGIGYVLGGGYFLPPLMFTPDEVEALLVGMSLLEGLADASLAAAAHDVLAKINAVVPTSVAPLMLQQTVTAPNFGPRPIPDSVDLAELRKAIRDCRKIKLNYVDEKDQRTTRVIWPIMLGARNSSDSDKIRSETGGQNCFHRWSNYEHRIYDVRQNRSVSLLRHGKRMCADIIRNERGRLYCQRRHS
jgi:predicted DNA-binding transcriptional regulator YafY